MASDAFVAVLEESLHVVHRSVVHVTAEWRDDRTCYEYRSNGRVLRRATQPSEFRWPVGDYYALTQNNVGQIDDAATCSVDAAAA
jgi:hypothetical protein